MKIYESLMSQWGIPFDYIEESWTDEQFLCLLDALVERSEKSRRQQTSSPGLSLRGFLTKIGAIR